MLLCKSRSRIWLERCHPILHHKHFLKSFQSLFSVSYKTVDLNSSTLNVLYKLTPKFYYKTAQIPGWLSCCVIRFKICLLQYKYNFSFIFLQVRHSTVLKKNRIPAESTCRFPFRSVQIKAYKGIVTEIIILLTLRIYYEADKTFLKLQFFRQSNYFKKVVYFIILIF